AGSVESSGEVLNDAVWDASTDIGKQASKHGTASLAIVRHVDNTDVCCFCTHRIENVKDPNCSSTNFYNTCCEGRFS
ncbi:hypothetical protein LINPERHAP2_LOCUS14674, partial [Linum perenne]